MDDRERIRPYTRDGYKVSPPVPVAQAGGEVIYMVMIDPDCFEMATELDLRNAFRWAISPAQRQNLIVIASAGFWMAIYSMPYNVPQAERWETFVGFVRELDKVFGLPSAFDPGEADMSFLDEGPIDPDDPIWQGDC